MKLKRVTLSAVLLTCLAFNGLAQNGGMNNYSGDDKPSMNFVKFNVTGLLLKNYSLQYERAINKTISVAFSYRTMPSTSLPFKKQLKEAVGDDPDTQDIIDNLELSNMAITPEVRFYLGQKGYGRGFYIAPFYRYAKFKTNHWILTVDNSTEDKTVSLSGDLTSNTAGILFGAQWGIGKYMVLDWWILGPHYGKANGNFTGVPNKPLTQSEQDELRTNLEDFDLPLTDKTITVTANRATLGLDGPWAGVRAGISFGVKF